MTDGSPRTIWPKTDKDSGDWPIYGLLFPLHHSPLKCPPTYFAHFDRLYKFRKVRLKSESR